MESVAMSKKPNNKQMDTWAGSMSGALGAATTSNLATTFTPKTPMYTPGVDKKQLKVWLDVPEDLAAALDGGMEKIGVDCLEQNAELVLELFQEMCLTHVLDMQIQDRSLYKLIRGNPQLDGQLDGSTESSMMAGKVAKSSLLGRTRSVGR